MSAYSLKQLEAFLEGPKNPRAADSVPPLAEGTPWLDWKAKYGAVALAEAPETGELARYVDTSCYTALCEDTRVWLVSQSRQVDADRWEIFVASRKPKGRLDGFVSPFADHARRHAEELYGAPEKGWKSDAAN